MAYVVFWDDEENIIGSDYTYIGDDESEIKIDETETAELLILGEKNFLLSKYLFQVKIVNK